MGFQIRRAGGRVYGGFSWWSFIGGAGFAGMGTALAVVSVSGIIANGGMKFEVNGRDLWLAPTAAYAVTACFVVPCLLIGVTLLLGAGGSRYELDDVGISEKNSFGKTLVRARWDQVLTVSTDSDDQVASTRVITTEGVIEIPHDTEGVASLLRTVRRHTRPQTAAPATQGADATPGHEDVPAAPTPSPSSAPLPAGGAAPAPVAVSLRGPLVFEYGFPGSAVWAAVPAFGLGLAALWVGKLADTWPLCALGFGVFLAAVAWGVLVRRNAQVILNPDRLIVVNAFGNEVMNVTWGQITGLVYDSTTLNNWDIYVKKYRVEAGTRSAKIGSTLGQFEECIREIELRMPADATVAG